VDYALDVLKLDGINLLTHTGNRYLGHPEEDELYAALDRRGAVVFVHPVRPQALPPVDYPAGYTELVFDTTRAIANLLCTGTLAKYPNIRFIMSHMGGVTPFLLFRLSGLDDEPKLRARFPDGVAAHLRRLYYDVAQSAAPLSFRALLEIADPSRIPVRHRLSVRAQCREGHDGYDRGACALRWLRRHAQTKDRARQRTRAVSTLRQSRRNPSRGTPS
jgi:predicted TIM-barrel fold metal-dependent hydrolase